jgi:hypothetical protein
MLTKSMQKMNPTLAKDKSHKPVYNEKLIAHNVEEFWKNEQLCFEYLMILTMFVLLVVFYGYY